MRIAAGWRSGVASNQHRSVATCSSRSWRRFFLLFLTLFTSIIDCFRFLYLSLAFSPLPLSPLQPPCNPPLLYRSFSPSSSSSSSSSSSILQHRLHCLCLMLRWLSRFLLADSHELSPIRRIHCPNTQSLHLRPRCYDSSIPFICFIGYHQIFIHFRMNCSFIHSFIWLFLQLIWHLIRWKSPF